MSKDLAREQAGMENVSELDREKISRVAAFLVTAHGEGAAQHALRIEAQSAVPAIARRVRLEVERLTQASDAAGEGSDVSSTPARDES